MKKSLFILLLCLQGMPAVFGLTVGSNADVSRESQAVFSGQGNSMLGFAAMEGGFRFEDASTTASYDAFFPISGDMQMSGGDLYLKQDLSLSNSVRVLGGGRVFGGDHCIEFPCGKDKVYLPTLGGSSVSDKEFDLVTDMVLWSWACTVDWSHDDKYLAVGTNYEGTGDHELKIFYFDGMSLTLTASANVIPVKGGPTYPNKINSVRWHPSEYTLAVAADSNAQEDLFIYQYDGNDGSFGISDAEFLASDGRAVAWNPSGNYLVCGTTNSSKELIVYSYASGLITQESVLNLSNDHNVLEDAMDWDPAGNYLAVGFSVDSSVNELSIYYFNGSTLTATVSSNIAKSVTALDWSPTGSFIAVGLGTGSNRLRVYEHVVQEGDLNLVESINPASDRPVFSVDWTSNGECLAAGLDRGSNTELKVYSFDKDATDLTLLDEVNRVRDAMGVRWTSDNRYLAVALANGPGHGGGSSSSSGGGDFPTGGTTGTTTDCGAVAVYDFGEDASTCELTFEDVKLAFNSDLCLTCTLNVKGNVAIDGGGNILDMTTGGDIVLCDGATLCLRNIFVKGYGSRQNQFNFATDNTELRLAHVNLDFVSSVTISQGGIVVEGQSILIMKDNDWTFDNDASITVDSVTAWIDRAGAPTNGEVFYGGDESNYFTSVNSGTIKPWGDSFFFSDLIIQNSDAIVEKCEWIENNSNAIIEKCEWIENNSNAILDKCKEIENNSNAIIEKCEWIENNSHAIIDKCEWIENNSNAIIDKCEWIENNSNSIVTNSDAIVEKCKWIEDNSHAIIDKCEWIENNSNAIIDKCEWIENNSNSIVTNSDAIVEKCKWIEDNSHAIIDKCEWIENNSNAIIDKCEWIENNSNSIVTNSDAIVEKCKWIEDNSHAIIDKCEWIENNSNAIIDKCEWIENNSNSIVTNSDAIVEKCKWIEDNSHAIIDKCEWIENNSNAIIDKCEWIENNSNAIIDKCEWIENNSNSIVTNSDAIVDKCKWIVDNSEAVVLHGNVFIGDININGDEIISWSHDLYLSPDHILNVSGDVLYEGNSHFIHFSREDGPVLFVENNFTLTFEDVVLMDFSPENIDLGDNSSIIFGDKTFIELAGKCVHTLNTTWTFSNNTVLHGGGSQLCLGPEGNIVVLGGSTLTFNDIKVKGLNDHKIRALDDDSSIVYCNSELNLDGDYSFTTGSMLWQNDVVISGTNTFVYSSAVGSTIDSGANLKFACGMTFSYDAQTADKGLIIMDDETSTLFIDGAEVHSTATGMQLTKGTLKVDNCVTFSSEGQVPSEAITIGNCVADDDVNVIMLSAAELNAYGPLEYQNVN